jgi:hypothetical protein
MRKPLVLGDIVVKIARSLLFVSLFLALLIAVSTSLTKAQEPEAQRSLQNRDFETGALNPWVRRPADALGTLELRTNRNHTPNSVEPNYNVRLGLQGEQINVQQNVVSYPNDRYYLGAFAVTSDSSVTANLSWNANLCGSTNEQYSSTETALHYPLLSCDFVTGATQNVVKIKLGGNASSGAIMGDDFYLIHLPDYTSSYYMRTVDPETIRQLGYQKGCAAHGGENGVIFLDFGPPRIQGTVYGTRLFTTGTFASTTEIADAAIAFIDGYVECAATNEHIIIALGTNNCGNGPGGTPEDPCRPGGNNVTNAHGQAWAQMVRNVHTYITSPPSYADKISVFGASDIEPGWNNPQESRAWVDGYASVQNRRPYYDFGSCDSCPRSDCLTCVIFFDKGGGVQWTWTLDDVFYVGYGAGPANAFPEIYVEKGWNADQWYRLSLWAYQNHGYRITFSGALTTMQACDDTGDVCAGYRNSPGKGWGQLAHWITSDSRTNSAIPFSSDIRWTLQ